MIDSPQFAVKKGPVKHVETVMHAYVLASNRVISPFNRPVGEMRIHNRRLRDLQLETLQALGCTVEWIERIEEVRRLPSLVIADDLYFTHQAMSGFLKAASRSDQVNSRAALAVSILTERFSPAFQGPQVDGPDGTPCRAYDCYLLRQFDPQVPLEASGGTRADQASSGEGSLVGQSVFRAVGPIRAAGVGGVHDSDSALVVSGGGEHVGDAGPVSASLAATAGCRSELACSDDLASGQFASDAAAWQTLLGGAKMPNRCVGPH